LNTRSTTWVWLGLALVFAVGLGFETSGLRARFFGRKRYRFVYAAQSSRADEGKTLEGHGWRNRSIRLESGVTLQILERRASDAKAPWLFFFPGNDKQQLTGGQRLLDQIRGEHDVNLCVLSYRGFSGSSGEPEVENIRQDVVILTGKILREEHVERFHLAGFSIGGYFAAWTAHALTAQGLKPASIMLFAPGYDLVMLRPSRWERYAVGDDYQMAPFLNGIVSPTLVLQGSDDDAFEGPLQGRTTAEGIGELATYAEFPAVKHEAILEHEPALARARTFWPALR
jgi:hypothetical protein